MLTGLHHVALLAFQRMPIGYGHRLSAANAALCVTVIGDCNDVRHSVNIGCKFSACLLEHILVLSFSTTVCTGVTGTLKIWQKCIEVSENLRQLEYLCCL